MWTRARKPIPRRGAIVVLAAFLLIVMLGMVAFAVDLGMIALAQTQLQSAADAAAMAAADALSSGTATAITTAQTCGQANSAGGGAVAIVPAQDIVLGTWSSSSGTFTPVSGSTTPNAVQVTCVLSQSRSNALPFFFGKIFALSSVNLSAQAIAAKSLTSGCGFTGLNFINISGGSYTDSYDSSSGTYVKASAGSQGTVCGNGSISLSGGSTVVKGGADIGPSGSTSTSGGSSIKGTVTTLPANMTETAVNSTAAAASNNNASIPLSAKNNNPVDGSGNFNLAGGDSVTLPAGTYYFKTLTLSGGSTISVSAAVVIYVTGNVDISGGSVANTTAIPANFQLFCQGTTVTLSGSTQTYGEIYAPTANITRSGGGSDFFGSMVGLSLTLSGGGGLHYDTSLGGASSSSGAQLVQ